MKKVCVLIAAILFAIVLAGCGGQQESITPQAVAVVIGNHGSSMGLNLNSPLVKDTVTDAVMSYGFVSVVSVDGAPDILMANTYEVPDQYKNANPEKLKADARLKATNLLAELSQVVADDPEIDTLEALRLAVRSFATIDAEIPKTIVVADSGLSTTGLLDFRNNLLSAPPETVADALAERSAIPDFTGITVVWQQLGDVAAPQQTLTPKQRQQLEAIWGAIVEKGHGTFVYSALVSNPTIADVVYPTVSTVDLAPDAPIAFSKPMVTDVPADLFTEPTFLSEEQVHFVGDSAEYLYPDEAISAITPIADYLIAVPETKLLLIGTTAGDGDSTYTYKLSSQRASAVRSTLVSLGVDEENLIAIGLGSSDPWHIYGAGTSGALAAENRKVVLLDARTELAEELLDKYGG